MSFQKSLGHGELGEILYYQAHNGTLSKTDGRKSDFVTVDGTHVELKTDFWSMAKTPNFFIERYSDKEKQTPGGPWQSLVNGTCKFAYFYIKDLKIFTFDTQKLVEKMESLIPSLQPFDVRNTTWTTLGYRVPRSLLSDLYKETTLTVSIYNG